MVVLRCYFTSLFETSLSTPLKFPPDKAYIGAYVRGSLFQFGIVSLEEIHFRLQCFHLVVQVNQCGCCRCSEQAANHSVEINSVSFHNVPP